MMLTTPDNQSTAGKIIGVGYAGIVYSKGSTVESLKKGVGKHSNNWRERKNTKGKKIKILGGTSKKLLRVRIVLLQTGVMHK
ncbi:MAG: hypothetical protein VB031_07635 [Eubacteriaceae bacterium]|nr:hypothetical protein [Eubacteriaceae bacterium]